MLSKKKVVYWDFSSVSSSLSGAAANCWDDILRLKLSGMAEQRKAILNRVLGMLLDNAIFGWKQEQIPFIS